MNIRCFTAAASVTAAFVAWLGLATPASAQESSPPGTAPTAAPAASPVTLSSGSEDILKLSRAKITDAVTIAFIQNSDRRYAPTAAEILYLRQEGVSDRVLTAMLNQQSGIATEQTTPPADAPATEAAASSPQYSAPPSATAVEQTAPASTVYVVGNTPTYYSFYDPWPYWYDPWPYYYPYFSVGFYWGWGGCYSGYWNNYYHGDYHGHSGNDGHNGHDGNHQPPPSHGGGQPPPGHTPPHGQQANGNPPPAHVGSGPGSQPGVQASGGRAPGGANQPRSNTTRVAGTAPTGGPTSHWSNNGNPSTATRGNQAAGVTRSAGSGANNRIVAGPSWGQAGDHTSRAGYVTRGATTGNATGSPTSAWTRQGGQPVNRYAGGAASGPQRIAAGPSSSYPGGGNAFSSGRPNPVSSYGGTMNPGGGRSSGSFGGGSAPHASPGGGYQGGGGYKGGGGSHGGGGGFHR